MRLFNSRKPTLTMGRSESFVLLIAILFEIAERAAPRHHLGWTKQSDGSYWITMDLNEHSGMTYETRFYTIEGE